MLSCKTWVFLLLFWTVNGYKLNVPRLLLPYHPSVPMRFELEVGTPSGGCFKWRSNRPDVVKVNPLGHRDCSDRAEVVATAKVAGTHNAVIFADDTDGGATLSCVVTIDEVATIVIEHTTKVLYVDAAPAPITVVAFNADGDKFSTLGELPFEWDVSDNGGELRPLRIVPFEQSKYRAPRDIQELESQKKKGYLVLLEGLSSGSSTVQTKFQDSYFAKVAASSLDLVVVANLLLEPAYDIFIPVYSDIHFVVKIVKEQGVEEVPMPSPLYTLRLEDNKICSLNSAQSIVTALSKGTTNLLLHTENIDAKTTKNAAVRPPSTKIQVVDPESLQFAISGNNWVLEKDRVYTIGINLLDPHGNHMFIADNARFETVLPLDYFEIVKTTNNGTHFEVKARKSGRVTLRSKLTSFITEGGIEIFIKRKVVGEQQLEIVDPITVIPKQVIFPYLVQKKFEYPLKAIGGSGSFSWLSGNRAVCDVDDTGLSRSGELGWTLVTAVDRKNPSIFGTSKIGVLEAISLDFGKTRKEVEVGKVLYLNVQLYGLDREKGQRHIPFTDCRNVPFTVEVQNHAYFHYEKDIPSQIPTEGTGCGTIALKAIKSGDTRITVKYDKYSATIDVSAFPALKIIEDELLIPIGGAFKLIVEGGPRPWLLDPSQFFIEGKSANSQAVSSKWHEKLLFTCGQQSATTVDVVVGNQPTTSNEIPAVVSSTIRICCVMPSRLGLKVEEKKKEGNAPKCPSSAVTPILSSERFNIGVTAFGRCDESEEERSMVGIDSMELEWGLPGDGKNFLSLGKTTQFTDDQTNRGWIDATPKGKVGNVRVSVKSTRSGSQRLPNPVAGNLDIKLVNRASTVPSSLVLWNDVTATAKLSIEGGSGHFHLVDRSEFYDAQVTSKEIIVSPRKTGSAPLRLLDLCLGSALLEVPIKITDIHSLRIRAPSHVEVSSRVTVNVDVVDVEGEPFSADYVSVMNLELETDSTSAKITRDSGMRFHLDAKAVGEVKLIASARASSGSPIQSRQHILQIYAPIKLYPRTVTLIPESTFQLEIVGGPRPTPPVSFTLNNTKSMRIESNALITSLTTLGNTLVTGTINQDNGQSTSDSVVVRVVSLAGIRLRVSTNRAKTGAKVSARVDGLQDDETPYSFGGATYPFKVKWSVSDPTVLMIDSSYLGNALTEGEQNRFGVSLSARAGGRVAIKVEVQMHPSARLHFQNKQQLFEAETTVIVDEAPALIDPKLPISMINIAPDAEYKLKSTWNDGQTTFSVPTAFSSLATVSKAGHLRTHSITGSAGILLARTSAELNESVIVPLQVSAVGSLWVDVVPPLTNAHAHTLMALPVGLTLNLKVYFRDRSGLRLLAAANKIQYRPHRFDLTDISASNQNRTITITLKTPGETVLRIWDSDERNLQTFIRIYALDQLTPNSKRSIVVSDLICFVNPVEGVAEWRIDGEEQLQLLQGSIGLAKKPGNVVVEMKSDQGLSMHATILINPVGYVGFSSSQSSAFVSNFAGESFVFPLHIARHSNESTKETSVIGCAKDQPLPRLSAPITCSIHFSNQLAFSASHLFTAKSTFDETKGLYACVIQEQVAGRVPLSIVDTKPTDIIVTANWNDKHASNIPDAVITRPFYMAFEILDKQLTLSSLPSHQAPGAVLSIRVPPAQLSKIAASGCADWVTITETTGAHSLNANKHYLIQTKRGNSVQPGHIEKCEITISNALTGQAGSVAINIRGIDKMTAQLTGAESATFLQLLFSLAHSFSWLFIPLMTLCIAAIILIAVWLILRSGSVKLGTAANNVAGGVFASDRSNPNISYQSSAGSSPSASYVWRESPPRYHSTPIDNTPTLGPIGSGGSPQLWTSSNIRRRL
ncbi:unnamed protein product, partial [Mesorhabditis belari]|uniref:Nuclear pore membrane glycoprotein 210 n=1 Tax=Mesorhabditis belari TaxID=2138241 RepID=A0AAF3FLK3_9BILA